MHFLATGIGKTKVDKLSLVFADHFQDIFRCPRHTILLC